MPGAGRGHGPQEKGKARDGWKPQRSRPPQLEHARRRSRSKGPKKRSAAPSPARGHTPQEENLTIRVDRFRQAANYVMQNTNLETTLHFIEQLDKMQKEQEEGERRRACRAERPQRAKRSAPADAHRSRADHPDNEYSRSQRADRGHGRPAARGDEYTSAPRAGSGPELRASRGHGRTRRDDSSN